MRVLYFSRSHTVHDQRFLLKLADSRHDVAFLRLEDERPLLNNSTLPKGIREVVWPGEHQPLDGTEDLLRLMPSFGEIITQVKPDMVQAGPIQTCAFMTALSGFRPLLAVSWGSDILVKADENGFMQWATRYTLERSDMLLCDCEAVKTRAQQIVGDLSDERIVQFPWGIDLTRFSLGPGLPGLRERLGGQGTTIVLSVRSWEQEYGVELVLEAFRKAREKSPALRLIMLGDGSLATRIDDFISRHGLDEVTYRPGMVPNEKISGYFRSADVYLSGARSDGASVSLLEAMATGLLPVVTDAPGNREWIEPGRNGWLAEYGDSDDFARKLGHAAKLGVAERHQMHLENRRTVEERANWNVNSTKLLEAYDRIEDQYGGQVGRGRA